MTLSSKKLRHDAYIYKFQKILKGTTSVQKLKLVLVFPKKKTAFFLKNGKKVPLEQLFLNVIVIFEDNDVIIKNFATLKIYDKTY